MNYFMLVSAFLVITFKSFWFASITNCSTIIDCTILDELALVEQKLGKFVRIDGKFKLQSEMIDLDKFGYNNVKVPIFKYDKIVDLSDLGFDGVIRIIPEGADLYAFDDIGITIYVYEALSNTRKHLKLILSEDDYLEYKDTDLFEFYIDSLGIHKNNFNCENQKEAVSMFVTSELGAFSFSGENSTEVYYLSNINAMLLVPSSKDKDPGSIKFISPRGSDHFTVISIIAEWSELFAVLESLEKM